MPQPSHHRRNPAYVELLRRYTQARMQWRIVAPLITLQNLEITERQYCDTYVDICFPPYKGREFGQRSRDMAFEEALIEVFA